MLNSLMWIWLWAPLAEEDPAAIGDVVIAHGTKEGSFGEEPDRWHFWQLKEGNVPAVCMQGKRKTMTASVVNKNESLF